MVKIRRGGDTNAMHGRERPIDTRERTHRTYVRGMHQRLPRLAHYTTTQYVTRADWTTCCQRGRG